MSDFIMIDGKSYFDYDLARLIGVSSPGGEGSEWLLSLASTYVDERERITSAQYPQDELSELADSSVPDGTFEQWQIFMDLALWQMDSELLGGQLATAFLENGPYILLYEIASGILNILANDHDPEAMRT